MPSWRAQQCPHLQVTLLTSLTFHTHILNIVVMHTFPENKLKTITGNSELVTNTRKDAAYK